MYLKRIFKISMYMYTWKRQNNSWFIYSYLLVNIEFCITGIPMHAPFIGGFIVNFFFNIKRRKVTLCINSYGLYEKTQRLFLWTLIDFQHNLVFMKEYQTDDFTNTDTWQL